MRVAFGSDHGGAELKRELFGRVAAIDPELTLVDLGGDGSDPLDDYPDISLRLGRFVANGAADRGILICGSGVGAAIAATKVRGVRASVCHDTYSAGQGVVHDDMNVLCLGARVVGIELALDCVRAFLAAQFSLEPRHRRRVAKVLAIEESSGQLSEADLDAAAERAARAGASSTAVGGRT